jgi:hypothetical protein
VPDDDVPNFNAMAEDMGLTTAKSWSSADMLSDNWHG